MRGRNPSKILCWDIFNIAVVAHSGSFSELIKGILGTEGFRNEAKGTMTPLHSYNGLGIN